jgi:hypothetical protein
LCWRGELERGADEHELIDVVGVLELDGYEHLDDRVHVKRVGR